VVAIGTGGVGHAFSSNEFLDIVGLGLSELNAGSRVRGVDSGTRETIRPGRLSYGVGIGQKRGRLQNKANKVAGSRETGTN